MSNATSTRLNLKLDSVIIGFCLESYKDDSLRTHSTECWRWHPSCAVRLLCERLDGADYEISTLLLGESWESSIPGEA